MDDVNKMADGQPVTNHPIEDARLSESSPLGEYRVYVNRFGRRNGPDSGTPFSVTLLVNGSPVDTKSGVAGKISGDTDNNEAIVKTRPVMTFVLPQRVTAEVPPECRADGASPDAGRSAN